MSFQVPCGGELPLDVECVVADDSVCAEYGCDQNQNSVCSVEIGLACTHANQPQSNGNDCKCCDYKVRFLCSAGKLIFHTHVKQSKLCSWERDCQHSLRQSLIVFDLNISFVPEM